LGRAGAARPSPPARPVAPPGPPARASGSATTTHRGRAPSLRTPAMWRVPPPRAQPAPVPTAQLPTRGAPYAGLACLVALVVKRGRCGPHPPRRPGSATDLPPANATSPASPASRPPGPSSSRRRHGSHRGLHPFRWSRSPGQLDPVPNATA
jgi:hypothetical protein